MALKSLNAKAKKGLTIVVVAVAVVGIGWYVYHRYKVNQELKHPKFYSGNGRLEATEVYVSAKLGGRIDKILVKEGDLVKKGQKLVQMETDSLNAERERLLAQIEDGKADLAQAEAGLLQAVADQNQSNADLDQVKKDLEQAKADVIKKKSSLDFAKYKYDQQKELLSKAATAAQKEKEAHTAYVNAKSEFESAEAKVESTKAKVKSAEAKVHSAKAKVKSAEAKVSSAKAKIKIQEAELKKTDVDIKDSTLYAHYDGRVQDLLAHEGEVLSAGGRVMNVIALTDVYMTFFLPTNIIAKLRLGAEVKLIFDAAPDKPIPATITFIDPVAQFTPKSVETQVEREKLMFRVKASIDPKLLSQYLEHVKTGLPGVAWVKLDPNASWKDCPAEINLDFEVPSTGNNGNQDTAAGTQTNKQK